MTEMDRSDPRAMAAFLDPGLDFETDGMSVEEIDRYLGWCARVHGEGNLDLVPFAEFFVECDPAGLKVLRRHTAKIDLPIGAAVLMWAHTYCVLGSAKGTLYEVIAARELGITRAQMIDVIRCAGFVAGPYALNAAGELTLPYLRRWPPAGDSVVGATWPTGWAADPNAFAAGIDHRSDELEPDELRRIADWYTTTHGAFPEGLRLAAQTHPSAFKLARIRFERIVESSLPAQLFPLLMLHTALVQGRELEATRAIQLAARLNVDRRVIAGVVHWASVLGGEPALERGMHILQRCEPVSSEEASRTARRTDA